MDRVLRLHVSRPFTFYGERMALGFQALPRAFVQILRSIGGMELLHVEVLLVSACDGEAEADGLVMAESDSRQRGLARTERIPARSYQMDRSPEGRNLQRAMGVAGEHGLAGSGQFRPDHPVVTALRDVVDIAGCFIERGQ